MKFKVGEIIIVNKHKMRIVKKLPFEKLLVVHLFDGQSDDVWQFFHKKAFRVRYDEVRKMYPLDLALDEK